MRTDATEIARQLAARRKREQRTCPVDGTLFEGTTRAVYCSSKCKLKAQRARRKADPLKRLHDETARQRRNDIKEGRDYL